MYGEVIAGEHRRRGDERDDADEALDDIAPSRSADVGLAFDHLRRRAGGGQSVEARDRAARDRDEREREERSGMIGPPPDTNWRAGIFSSGFTIITATTRNPMVPIFMKELR